MSQITDEQVERFKEAFIEESGSAMWPTDAQFRRMLEAALSTPPVGAETGEPVAFITAQQLAGLKAGGQVATLWSNAPAPGYVPLFDAPPRSDKANVVKAGDTVRVLRARNAYGQDVYDFGSKPFAAGETFVVGRVDEESTGYPCPIVFPKGEGIDFWRADDLEVVSTSPAVPNTVGEDKL